MTLDRKKLTVGAPLRVTLFLQPTICRDQATCAQPEALGHTNRHSATKKSLILFRIFDKVFLKILRKIA